MFYESLQSRLLLSTVTLVNGLLTIEGTSGNDNVYVTVGTGNKLNVYDSNVLNGSFTLPSVKKIVFHGNNGNDAYYAGSNIGAIPSTVDGGEGDDNLYCGSASDSIIGGAGDDELTGNDGDDYIDGGEGEDNLGGGKGNDTLLGGAGVGDDLLVGGEGNDFFDGGLGSDQFRGGQGSDTVSYAGRTNDLVIDITGTPGEPHDDGEAGEEDFVEYDVENIIGGEGNDLIIGTTLQPSQLNEIGVTTNNILRGNGGNDTIIGLDGNDILDGGLGTDILTGGDGVDTADYGSRTQNLTLDLDGIPDDGAAGENDRIDADIENLTGGSGNDSVIGNNFANVLTGNAGNDTLDGGLGADILIGSAGSDTADYSTRATALLLNLDGTANDGAKNEKDRIGKDIENLFGGGGADVITGNASANILRGGAGKDIISGGDGNDSLYGDGGADKLFGQGGNDALYDRSKPALKDIFDGGAGKDKAQLDKLDSKTSIETLLK